MIATLTSWLLAFDDGESWKVVSRKQKKSPFSIAGSKVFVGSLVVRNAPFFKCAVPVLALFPKSQIQVLLFLFLEVSLALLRSLSWISFMILRSSGLMLTSMYVTVVLAPLSLLVNVALLFLVPFHGGNLALRMLVSSRWIELQMRVHPLRGVLGCSG